MALQSSTWKRCGNKFFRKFELYIMGWSKEIELENYIIAAAPFGGPIAMIRDDKKLTILKPGQSATPRMYIYSASGVKLSSFQFKAPSRLIKIGWTNTESLVCVLENGSILIYSIHGELISQFSLNLNFKKLQMIIDVQFFSSGFVALSQDFELFCVSDYIKPNPILRLDPKINEPPTCWTIVDPKVSNSGSIEILIATTDGKVYVVDSNLTQDQFLTQGPFTHLCVVNSSKVSNFLAAFTSSGKIIVFSIDFQEKMNIDTKRPRPSQLVWCGLDSLLLVWDKELLLIGPTGGSILWDYETPIRVIPESDGVRVVSSSTSEFIQQVPTSTSSIFSIGSITEAAMLYDAYTAFCDKSPKADENIRRIRGNLQSAVEQCIEAAEHEYSQFEQKKLLRAAAYGKAFLDFYPPDEFVSACQRIRVLNAIRHFTVGLPLTIAQLNGLSMPVLIDRLTNRHHYFLAIRIAEYLSAPTDRILIHWAVQKIKASYRGETDGGTGLSDVELYKLLMDKLKSQPGLSFIEVSSAANTAGRPELAISLLEHEPRAADQVPLLLNLAHEDVALSKAIQSGDTDLVYYVLLHLKRMANSNRKLFEALLSSKGRRALGLLIGYCKARDLSLLDSLFEQKALLDPIQQIEILRELSVIKATEAYKETTLSKRIAGLEITKTIISEPKDEFRGRAIDEQIKLYNRQSQFNEVFAGNKRDFLDGTVAETLEKLLDIGDESRAKKFVSEMSISEKKYWWIKLKVLSNKRDWRALEKFSKSKNPPIGWKPFVECCIRYTAFGEAAKYISNLRDYAEKAEYWFIIGQFPKSFECAMSIKDRTTKLETLVQIKTKATGEVLKKVNAEIQKLK